MEKPTYKVERDRAINTLCTVIPAFGATLMKHEYRVPDEEHANTLSAYVEAETLLLSLLKEETPSKSNK